MSMNAALRRSLRRIPTLRALPTDKLETLASQIICREYQPGDVLWRSGARTDFLGIIQRGELRIERRIRGVVIHSTRLTAGNLLSPQKLSTQNSRSSVLVRAVTEVQLQILPTDRLGHLQMTGREAGTSFRGSRRWAGRLWVLLAAIALLLLSWKDITRIASGILYLLAKPDSSSAQNEDQQMRLLEYAGTVDRSAAFAPNQEGYLLFQQANLDHAEAAFAEAISRDPVGSQALNNLAVIYSLRRRYPLAVELEEKAVQNAPDDPILRYNLGLALITADRKTEALREFQQAIYIDPAWALPHLQKAYIYLQTQDYIRAEDESAEAVRLDPSQETAHLIRAVALYNQGKNSEALVSVQNALKLEPRDRVALFYEAMILSGLKQFDPALTILGDLLVSTHDSAEITRIKTEIEAVHYFQQESPGGTP